MTSESIIRLFSLNVSSGVPIYRQLIDQIKQSIRMEIIKENQQLPSVRNLATELQINPMTISKAYGQLELEGVLIRKRGVGMLVNKPDKLSPLRVEVEQSLKQFIAKAREEKLDDEKIISLVQQYLSLH